MNHWAKMINSTAIKKDLWVFRSFIWPKIRQVEGLERQNTIEKILKQIENVKATFCLLKI